MLPEEKRNDKPCRFCDLTSHEEGRGPIVQTSTAPDGTALYAHEECEPDDFAFTQNFKFPGRPVEPPFLTSLQDVIDTDEMHYASADIETSVPTSDGIQPMQTTQVPMVVPGNPMTQLDNMPHGED